MIVYTAVIGDTFPVCRPTAIDPSVRYLCFSDQPCAAPYEWIPTEPDPSPMLAAKRVKILADHPVLHDADILLWHDSTYRLMGSLRWVRKALQRADLAVMPHPRRMVLEHEGQAIARYGYITVEQAAERISRYRRRGFPDWRLSSGGLVVRRMTPEVRVFNARWWRETTQVWGGRDQGSLDYAAWSCGVRLTHLPGTIRDNPYAIWCASHPVEPLPDHPSLVEV